MEKAQYAILRFAKYKGLEIGRIEAHDERTKEVYASNPDVDTSRSKLNFHLVQPQRRYRAECEKQIIEAGCRTRSDSVRMVEALITASRSSSRARAVPRSRHSLKRQRPSLSRSRTRKPSFPPWFTWTKRHRICTWPSCR